MVRLDATLFPLPSDSTEETSFRKTGIAASARSCKRVAREREAEAATAMGILLKTSPTRRSRRAQTADQRRNWDYPTSDGRPMAETDWHRNLMMALIQTLQFFYSREPMVYVSGNLLLFYEPGNRRKHVSPDVFVVLGVAKHDRPNFLLWEERSGPAIVIEVTSKSTRKEDLEKKLALYRDVLKVKEYVLFDPLGDYLKPRLQGYRLRKGEYVPIRFKGERLPSRNLGLHLEPSGRELRLYDPKTAAWLPTPTELAEKESVARQAAEAEADRLRRELEQIRQASRARNTKNGV